MVLVSMKNRITEAAVTVIMSVRATCEPWVHWHDGSLTCELNATFR